MVRPLRHAARSMMREDDAGRTCAGRRADASAQRHLLSFARQCCWRSWRAGGEDRLDRPRQSVLPRRQAQRRTPPRACRSRAASRAAASPWSATRPSRSARPSASPGHGAPPPRTSRSPARARSSHPSRPRGRCRRSDPAQPPPISRAAIARMASRQIRRAGRASRLVRHDPQLAVALPGGKHGADEVLAGRRIHPRRPQHDRARARRQHGLLAGQLARAVDALRRRGVGLDIGRALEPVEHVVGGDVDQRDAGRLAQPRQFRRPVAVGPERRVRIVLGRIDRGIGRGIHHQRRRARREHRRRRCRGGRSRTPGVRPDRTASPCAGRRLGQRHRKLPGARR